MSTPVFLKRSMVALVGAVSLLAGATALADPPHHGPPGYHSHGPYYGGPYYDPYFRDRWHPRPRAWGPAIVVEPGYLVAPPPPVIYVPVPAVQQPVQAVPASPVYQVQDGRYCREYQTTVTVEGRQQPSFGTACLEADGAWRIVK